MKSLLGILAMTLGLLMGASGAMAQAEQSPPGAADLAARLAELNRKFAQVDQAIASRVTLLGRLDRYRRSIKEARDQEAGPARDFKLRRLLAEAQVLASKLSALDAELAGHQRALEEARRALVTKLSALKGAERLRVQRELARTRGAKERPPAVLKVARPVIDPLDGPREIEEKADVLKDSEEKIRKRIEEIDRVLANMAERRRLRAISQRVDRYTGIFNEDSSSRRVTRIRPTRITSTGDGATSAPAELDANPSSAYGSYEDTAGGSIGRSVSSGTYAVVLRELLTPATLNALRKAGQSGDPDERIRALQKARDELRQAASDLRNRSQTYRDRAKQLRTNEKR
ncbi:MAG: hypothetical protein RBU30_02820 [Polyangia bacterium]|nr:hypothetical protein [Polyangia bacterium]